MTILEVLKRARDELEAQACYDPQDEDVREPTDTQINVWSIIRSALSRAWALSRPWAVADRPQVTSEVVARLDAIAADCERELLTALRSEAQGEERAEDIARRIARDCRALHSQTPEEDAKMRDALLDMAGGIEERLASIPGAARRREGDGVPILSAKNRNREEM